MLQRSLHSASSLLQKRVRSLSSTHRILWDEAAGPLYTKSLSFPSEDNGDAKLAVVMHGLLGAGKNLKSFINLLFQPPKHSNWTAILVDLRCHGQSAYKDLQGPNTIENAAADVIKTIQNSCRSDINTTKPTIDLLIGHSLGGQVALEIVKQLQQQDKGSNSLSVPKQTWVLDSKLGDANHLNQKSTNAAGQKTITDDVSKVLQTLHQVPLPIPSREWLYDYLEKKGFSKNLGLWLGSSLTAKGKKEYEFTFDLHGATSMYDSYLQSQNWDVLENAEKGDTQIHIVQAERSDRLDEETVAKLKHIIARNSNNNSGKSSRGGSVEMHVVPNAGHWIHSDNPKGLAAIMLPYLD